MNQTQLEIDFRTWLHELSRDVVVRYGRWLEDQDGHDAQCDYCTECVEQEVADRKAKQDSFTEINGWDEGRESDGVPECDRCGCLIECSPTEELIRCDIQFLHDTGELDGQSAHSILNWLCGMGSYSREKHWPQIKPHAERLMRAAGHDIVPEGLIRYVPAQHDWKPHDTAWLAIYQYFARQLVLWMDQTDKGERGFLVLTTGRNISHFQSITKPQDAYECVQNLLRYVGQDCERGRFLAWMDLQCAKDLESKLLIPDDRCTLPTFEVRGRILEQSPNKFHPDAVVITHAELQLDQNADFWTYRMYYSDKHWERTSWTVSLSQNSEKTITEFCDSVRIWMDEILQEPGPDDGWRMDRMRTWDQVNAAINQLFWFPIEICEEHERLTHAFMAVKGVGRSSCRVKLTPERLQALTSMLFDSIELGNST